MISPRLLPFAPTKKRGSNAMFYVQVFKENDFLHPISLKVVDDREALTVKIQHEIDNGFQILASELPEGQKNDFMIAQYDSRIPATIH